MTRRTARRRDRAADPRLPRLPRARARPVAQHARGLPLGPAAVRRVPRAARRRSRCDGRPRRHRRLPRPSSPRAATPTRPPVAAATLGRKVACLRSFYRHLRREGLIEHDPTADAARAAQDPAPAARALARRGRAAAARAARHRAARAARPRAARADVRVRAARLGGDRPGARATSTSRRACCARAARAPRSGSCRSAARRSRRSRAYCARGRPALLGAAAESRLFLNRRGGGLTRQGLYKIVQGHARARRAAGRG